MTLADTDAGAAIDRSGWNGQATSTAIADNGWGMADGATVSSVALPFAGTRDTMVVRSGVAGFFSNAIIAGAGKYAFRAIGSASSGGLTIELAEGRGIRPSDDGADLVFEAGETNALKLSFGKVAWKGDGALASRPDGVSFPLILRQGEYVVLGDAREDAVDSRDFGIVRGADLLGKVLG